MLETKLRRVSLSSGSLQYVTIHPRSASGSPIVDISQSNSAIALISRLFESHSTPVYGLQRHQQLNDLLTHGTALPGRIGETLLGGWDEPRTNHAPAHILHQEERRADVARILATCIYARHRHGSLLQRFDYAILA